MHAEMLMAVDLESVCLTALRLVGNHILSQFSVSGSHNYGQRGVMGFCMII